MQGYLSNHTQFVIFWLNFRWNIIILITVVFPPSDFLKNNFRSFETERNTKHVVTNKETFQDMREHSGCDLH